MTASRRPGRPVAVTRDDGSLELFARGADDSLLHAHNDFFLGWSAETLSGPLAGDPTAVLTTKGKLHVFARGRGSRLLHWRQHPTDGQLLEPIDHGWRIGYDPVAAAGPDGSVGVTAVFRGRLTHVYAWDRFGARLWELFRDGETCSARAPAIPWPVDEVVAPPERRVPIRVDAIVARPADLLYLGLSWSGLDLVPGDPPVLRRTGDPALLMVALPPQHVGEEVSPRGFQTLESIH